MQPISTKLLPRAKVFGSGNELHSPNITLALSHARLRMFSKGIFFSEGQFSPAVGEPLGRNLFHPLGSPQEPVLPHLSSMRDTVQHGMNFALEMFVTHPGLALIVEWGKVSKVLSTLNGTTLNGTTYMMAVLP